MLLFACPRAQINQRTVLRPKPKLLRAMGAIYIFVEQVPTRAGPGNHDQQWLELLDGVLQKVEAAREFEVLAVLFIERLQGGEAVLIGVGRHIRGARIQLKDISLVGHMEGAIDRNGRVGVNLLGIARKACLQPYIRSVAGMTPNAVKSCYSSRWGLTSSDDS